MEKSAALSFRSILYLTTVFVWDSSSICLPYKNNDTEQKDGQDG
jgi:hypothetical protein